MITNPLVWPAGYPRATRRELARFSVTTSQATQHLVNEVRMMGGKDLLITTDKPASKLGYAFASKSREPADPGVAVYFTVSGKELCLPCDVWMHVGDNIRALGKTVEALRGIERWGSRGLMEQAFAGFAALPAPAGSALEHPWWEVLGVAPEAGREVISSAYLRAVKAAHPDHEGGSHEAFLAVQQAYQQAVGQ